MSKEKFPFEVKESAKLGRYLIATKNLNNGHLILKEKALCVFPRIDIRESDIKPKVTCISCYATVERNKIVECNLCKWPFCSVDCSKDPYHKRLECGIFERNKVLWSPEGVDHLHLVRCVELKKTDLTKWNQIMSLADKYGTTNATKRHRNKIKADSGMKFLKSCGIKISLQELRKLVNITAINNFNIAFGTERELANTSSETKRFGALYAQSSLFAHGCNPNVMFKHFHGDAERWTIGFFSTVQIKKGEILTISYIGDYISQGTRGRRISLRKNFGFNCECSRCNDPTELGTFYSTLKCPRCPEGLIHTSKYSFEMFLFCNKCECYLKTKEVEGIENQFTQKLRLINEEAGLNRTRKLDELISEASSVYNLHPNHYLIIDAIEQWLSVCNFSILLESTPESKVMYEKILSRAKQALTIRYSFGTVSQIEYLQANIATAIILFQFKSQHNLPLLTESHSVSMKLDTAVIIKSLRRCIGSDGLQGNDSEIISFLRDLEKRYPGF